MPTSVSFILPMSNVVICSLNANRKMVVAVAARDVSKEGDTLIDTKTERSAGVLGRA